MELCQTDSKINSEADLVELSDLLYN
jgi:hypothetical protein